MKRQDNSNFHYGDFVWDAEKAAANIVNHEGVTFEEATTIWDDAFYIDFYDPDHSWEEHRIIAVGMSSLQRLLIVSFTDREDLTRIITARKLDSGEQRIYENKKNQA